MKLHVSGLNPSDEIFVTLPLPEKTADQDIITYLVPENIVTHCPIPTCKSTFEKKNKSRDHLLKTHFPKELARDGLKDEKPHLCPLRGAECDANKIYKNYQELKHHYGGLGSVHGKLLAYLDDKLANVHGLKAEPEDNKISKIWV